MRDGAGLPAGLVPAAARARGVTDEGLAPVRGVGTGHADCRNSSRVTQGSPRRLSPPVWCPRAPTDLLWDAPGARPVHVPARHAVQVQMDPFGRPIARDGERRAARAAGSGGPGAGRVQPPAAPPPSKTQAPATLPAHTAAPTVVVTASGAGKRVWPHRAAAYPHAACRAEGPGGGPLGTDRGQNRPRDESSRGQRRGGDGARAWALPGPPARCRLLAGRDPGSPRPLIAPLGAAGSLLVVARGTRPVYIRPWQSAGRGRPCRPRPSRHAGAGGLWVWWPVAGRGAGSG
jgi:hypothetical protein